MPNPRITAAIHLTVDDMARPDFDELMDVIEEAAAKFDARLTVDSDAAANIDRTGLEA